MNEMVDPVYLRTNQYRQSERLNARIALHQRFSENQTGWTHWVFGKLSLGSGMWVLDVGCGPGSLWQDNRDRISTGVEILLFDLSGGMVSEALHQLSDPRFRFLVGDAQAIPFGDALFDLVIANHMLYHVPDIEEAIRQFSRVIKPGGRFIATTNGVNHMNEIHELARMIIPDITPPPEYAARFCLENAATMFSPFFENVEILEYPDSLWVTEAKPLLDYILSIGFYENAFAAAADVEQLLYLINKQLQKNGGIVMNKSSGMVLAHT